MRSRFKRYDPDQLFLLPPDVRDWMSKDHPAYFFSDVVDELDLAEIFEDYKDDMGQPPYDPRMMLKVWLFAYSQGIRSSRRVEKALHEVVAFRILSCNQQPDHWTLSEFRRRHLAAIEHLFQQSVQLASEAGLVTGKHVSVDGTKIKAYASKHSAMSYERMKAEEKRIREHIRQYLKEVEANDREEDRLYGDKCGYELPESLNTQQKRLEAIAKAKKVLEQRARDPKKRDDDSDSDKPKSPPPPARTSRKKKAAPGPKDQLNFTDPDSRIMVNSDKAFVQAYNAQAAVDVEHQIIVAADLGNQAADGPYLIPLVQQAIEHIGHLDELSADAAYWSDRNLDFLAESSIEAFIPPERVRHSEWREARPPRGRIPHNATRRQLMSRKLKTKIGRQKYTLRQTTSEPTYGQIKECRGLRQFFLRGLHKVQALWKMDCMVHNFLKIFGAGVRYAPQ